MFERFSDAARRVVAGAHEEARLLRDVYIGSEHNLLALTHIRESVAAMLPESVGVTDAAVRERVSASVGVGSTEPVGHIPFTSHAKRVFQRSMRECRELADDVIATEHLMPGLLDDANSTGSQLVRTLSGMDEAHLQQQLREKLADYRTQVGPPSTASADVVHVRLSTA